MYCNNCGSQISDEAVICPHCGVQVAKLKIDPSAPATADNVVETPSANAAAPQPQTTNAYTTPVKPQTTEQGNAVGIVGFVFSFFFPLVGLICSIIGLKKANQGAPYKGLCIAGVILSAIGLFFYIIFMSVCVPSCIAACNEALDPSNWESTYSVVMALL